MTEPQTADFFNLQPHTILDALEAVDFLCTGRCLQLNSLENRVYEIELEGEGESPGSRVVAKFYRPLRWTAEQIQDEHTFLQELTAADLPVVAPIIQNGKTLHRCPATGILFTVFPRCGGRNLDEFSPEQALSLGRVFARFHLVGARTPASHRLSLTLADFGRSTLEYLLQTKALPAAIESQFAATLEQFFVLAEPFFNDVSYLRLHGDAHVGNVLNRDGQFVFVDFDDMINGPAVQDLWLLAPGRDTYARALLRNLIEGYRELREFSQHELFLIEPLRVLRVLHFSAWIHRRWSDPYFQKTFESFGSDTYWNEQLRFFYEELEVFNEITATGEPLLEIR